MTAVPERGKANEAAISLLAERLGVAKTRIFILGWLPGEAKGVPRRGNVGP